MILRQALELTWWQGLSIPWAWIILLLPSQHYTRVLSHPGTGRYCVHIVKLLSAALTSLMSLMPWGTGAPVVTFSSLWPVVTQQNRTRHQISRSNGSAKTPSRRRNKSQTLLQPYSKTNSLVLSHLVLRTATETLEMLKHIGLIYTNFSEISKVQLLYMEAGCNLSMFCHLPLSMGAVNKMSSRQSGRFSQD